MVIGVRHAVWQAGNHDGSGDVNPGLLATFLGGPDWALPKKNARILRAFHIAEPRSYMTAAFVERPSDRHDEWFSGRVFPQSLLVML